MKQLVLILVILPLVCFADRRALLLSKRRPASGGSSLTCPADGSPTISQTDWDTSKDAGYNSTFFSAGQTITIGAANTNLCKVGFQLTKVGADFAGGVNFVVKVYTLSGDDLVSLVATSDPVSANNSWAFSEQIFSFTGNITLTASTRYGIVCERESGTDTGSYIRLYAEGTSDLAGGNLVNYNSSGVEQSGATSADAWIKLYFKQ